MDKQQLARLLELRRDQRLTPREDAALQRYIETDPEAADWSREADMLDQRLAQSLAARLDGAELSPVARDRMRSAISRSFRCARVLRAARSATLVLALVFAGFVGIYFAVGRQSASETGAPSLLRSAPAPIAPEFTDSTQTPGPEVPTPTAVPTIDGPAPCLLYCPTIPAATFEWMLTITPTPYQLGCPSTTPLPTPGVSPTPCQIGYPPPQLGYPPPDATPEWMLTTTPTPCRLGCPTSTPVPLPDLSSTPLETPTLTPTFCDLACPSPTPAPPIDPPLTPTETPLPPPSGHATATAAAYPVPPTEYATATAIEDATTTAAKGITATAAAAVTVAATVNAATATADEATVAAEDTADAVRDATATAEDTAVAEEATATAAAYPAPPTVTPAPPPRGTPSAIP